MFLVWQWIFLGSLPSMTCNFSKSFSRIKYGHPEGYLSAFSNLYKEIALKINLKKSKKRFYFPTAYEGLLTAKFIDGCVKSS